MKLTILVSSRSCGEQKVSKGVLSKYPSHKEQTPTIFGVINNLRFMKTNLNQIIIRSILQNSPRNEQKP